MTTRERDAFIATIARMQAEIDRLKGLPAESVHQVAGRVGAEKRYGKPKINGGLSDDEMKQVLALRDEGLGYVLISRKVGATIKKVRYALMKAEAK